MKFSLDPKLEQDSKWVVDLPLCQVRLSHNAAFPWVILVPRLNDIVEIIDLSKEAQEQLLIEIRQTSQIVNKLYKPKKLNVANLGNIVAQLHVHIIARFETDQAWPNPVWNSGFSDSYTTDELNKVISQLKKGFQELEHG